MTCPFCHADVSPASSACPRCGRALPAVRRHAPVERSAHADAGVTVSDSPAPVTRITPRPSPSPSPATRSASLTWVQPGTDLGPRYHIESALGEGGMGSVYRAYDRELDRLVAIKVIRPGLVADPAAVQRFKQELLLGSKVSHKHILRIHDLGDVEGLKFISMAFVDGEDLHTILRREGRLPISRAVDIARQIAGALAAAHAEGVVHRDLKPHNILIDRSGTAFVSDFGLAKSLESAAAGMTRSGELLGTPRYMAPEQVEGRGQLDHRVDLYALGLILYEMVTGAIPFHGDSAIQELLERVRTPAPDPRTVNADVPRDLADVILRCLEKDPDGRFQNADELLAALDAASGYSASARSISGVSRTWRRVSGWRRRPLRTRVLAAGMAALGLAVVAVLAVRSLTGPEATPAAGTVSGPPTGASPAGSPARRVLAVLPFRVLGSEEQLRYIADGVVEAVSSKLFQLDTLQVVSNRDVGEARTGQSVGAAARSLGASLIVEGTVQAAGSQLRLVVNLHDIMARRQIWSQQFTGAQEDLFALQDGVYDGLVTALGIPAAAGALARSATRPTDDIEAYDLYLKGRDALRSRHDPAQVQAAIDYFEQAIRKDGGFALAHAGLADASLLMYEEKKDSFWAERAQAAAQRGRDLNDLLPEVHFSLGSVYLQTGKNPEAVVVLKRALELAPNSDEAQRRLGFAYQVLGRKQDALDALRKTVEVNPYFWLNHNALGAAYLHFGETDKALEAFRRVTELEPQNPVGYDNMGSVYFAQGRWEDCIPAYQRAIELQPHWLTYANLGTAYFFLKRYGEAVSVFEKAASMNQNDAITLGNLADALRWSGERDRSLLTYSKAIALGYEELQVNPRDPTTLAMIALYNAKSGNAARASEFIRRARSIDSRSPALLYHEAVTHTLAGREQAALTSLEQALAGGYPAREAAADPELDALSKSPAFGRLLRRYSTGPT